MFMTFFTPVRWHLFDENLRFYSLNAYCKKTGKAIFTDEQLKPIEIDETFDYLPRLENIYFTI